MSKAITIQKLTIIAAIVSLAFFRLPVPNTFEIDESLSAEIASFPLQLGSWRGSPLEVDEITYEILETRNLVSRLYTDPQGREAALLLVASRQDRRVAHPPEVCYVSSNYQILNESVMDLETAGGNFPVKAFVAQSERYPDDRQEVLYLYKVGDSFTTNYYKQQFSFALDSLTGGDKQVYLIRLAGRDRSALSEFLPFVVDALSQNPADAPA